MLVVDDEALLLMAAIAMVDHAGFEAVEAANAAQAIEVFRIQDGYRIVFSDIDMPQGADGVRLAAIIRERWPQIEIILTSGFLETSRKKAKRTSSWRRSLSHFAIICRR